MENIEKEYIYIVQSSSASELARCKIGKTNDLERRLKEYNNITGLSKGNTFQYLFACEVADMMQLEKDIKKEFPAHREKANREIYFYSEGFFNDYVKFIKGHPDFIAETFIKTEPKKEVEIQIIKKTTPSLKERGLTHKDVMQRAQKAKNDEFYTRYEDIEKEISMYDKNIWEDKCVFCNCDDAVDNDERNSSAFALYFLRNFKELKLKKLICTHYGGGWDIFNQGGKGYIFTKDGFCEIEDYDKLKDYPKNYSGSFDDPLSLKILNEEADIVCTNPPFSRSIDYWKILIKSGKKFLVISNIANITRPVFILYFMKKQVWAGYNDVYWYENPKRELTRAAGFWFTNFSIENRPKSKNLKIVPLKEIPEKYIKYDDSKKLIVDESYIPSDYKKPFAVSVNPIVNGILEKGYRLAEAKEYYPYVNGEKKFARVLVQKI